MTETDLNQAVTALNKAQLHYDNDIAKYGGKHMEHNYTPATNTEYASKGVAGSGLGLGIAGTALGILNNGGLGNLLNGGNGITRNEFTMSQELAAKDAKIGLLESQVYVDQKLSDVYAKLENKIEAKWEKTECLIGKLNEKVDFNKATQEAINLQQATLNATQTATIACIQNQVAQLQTITKLVVPNTSVCPGWGNVNITPATTTAA